MKHHKKKDDSPEHEYDDTLSDNPKMQKNPAYRHGEKKHERSTEHEYANDPRTQKNPAYRSAEHEYDDTRSDNPKTQKNPAYHHGEKKHEHSHEHHQDHSHTHKHDHSHASEHHSHYPSHEKYKHGNIVVATANQTDKAYEHVCKAKEYLTHLHQKSKEVNNIRSIIVALQGLIQSFNEDFGNNHKQRKDQSHVAIVRINENSLVSCEEYFRDIFPNIDRARANLNEPGLRHASIELEKCKDILDSILKKHRENK